MAHLDHSWREKNRGLPSRDRYDRRITSVRLSKVTNSWSSALHGLKSIATSAPCYRDVAERFMMVAAGL